MNRRQRLAALRTESAALSARLADGSATDADYTRAIEVSDEIRSLVAEIEEHGYDDQAGNANDDAAARAREALANLPEDPQVQSRNAGNGGDGGQAGNRGGGRPPVLTQERLNPIEDVHRRVEQLATDFTEGQPFQQLRARGFSGQAAFDFANLRGTEYAMRATIDSTGSPNRQPYAVQGVFSEVRERPLTILDMIDRQTTGLSSIDFVQETTSQAAREADALEVAEGTLKPEASAPVLVEVSSPVRTIAAWNNVTRTAAEDNATLYGLIRGRLPQKVLWRLNSQILNGNGTSPNLRGINNTAGINTYAPAAAEAWLISIRKAITMCQVDEYQPQTVALHPTDWEVLELDTDDNGRFRVAPNVQGVTAPRIWGLTVVISTYFTAGTAMVGDFQLGATLWERQGVRLLMTDSHASNFTSNILTLLAEMRAALTVWRPSAFCRVTFNDTPAG